MIATDIDRTLDLTIHTCSDVISIEEIENTITEHYKGQPTKNIIWDFTNAEVQEMKADMLRSLALKVKHLSHSREHGKTALVAQSPYLFGLGRMYQAFAEVDRPHIKLHVFENLTAAYRWFQE